VFIASTNLMNNIDSAAMRRFDLKLEFKSLKPEQAWRMFSSLLEAKGISSIDKEYAIKNLNELNLLTPGDFSTAIRRFEIGGQELNTENLIMALNQECHHKPGYSRSVGMGFLSDLCH
jgi:SpoVK/Ycf46/Vps4 family AAA+-type ATPase